MTCYLNSQRAVKFQSCGEIEKAYEFEVYAVHEADEKVFDSKDS